MQGRNRDADVGNGCVDMEQGWGMNWKIGIDICALPRVKQIASGDLHDSAGNSAWRSVVT